MLVLRACCATKLFPKATQYACLFTLDGDAITDENTTVAIKVQIGEPVSFIEVTYG